MPAILNSSGLKSVCRKLRFRDGLVRTGGLTGEMKLRFQIPPPNCERALDFLLLGVILVALFWLIVFVLFFSFLVNLAK